jgi:hypothetical protein
MILGGLELAMGLTAAPAAAQSWGFRSGAGIRNELNQIVYRIHRAEDRDMITRREEHRLLRHVSYVDRLFYRYQRNGLSSWEHRDLRHRLRDLRRQLRLERQDRWL